jgi:hypothetical protein
VLAACKGASCVFHVASYGMSGREMLDVASTVAVNVQVGDAPTNAARVSTHNPSARRDSNKSQRVSTHNPSARRDSSCGTTVRAVHVQGTRNVIEACIASSVPRLVYTSTYNVLYGERCRWRCHCCRLAA